MRCSLLVLTYEWPAALRLALAGIARQRVLPDEVIVGDDGSGEATRAVIADAARDFPCRLAHVWHEDRGFRAARARNRAIAASRGEYVVIVDGDMLLHPRFVADHLALRAPGHFLVGGRLRAGAAESARLLAGGAPRFAPWMDGEFAVRHEFRRRHALRLPALARLAARGRGHVMSCNMSFWREDLVRANGFDERMEGYGSEDLELAARLVNAGVARRQLKYAGLAVHLHHPVRAVGERDDPALPNNRILAETRTQHRTRAPLGIDAHAAEFAQPPPDLRGGGA
jgi:glycosyltransferase involved in cell wall biosynthesis